MNTKINNTANNWNVEALRFTGYLAPNAQIENPTWWETIVGEPSEIKKVEMRKNLSQEKGHYGKGELVLILSPFRIDWTYKTLNDEGELRNSLDLYLDVVELFRVLMKKWFVIKNFPSLRRIAFGSIIFQPVESRSEGYKKLIPYLHNVKVEPERSSDLIYQINRTRKSQSGINKLMINRLSKWSVQRVKLVGVEIFNDESQEVPRVLEGYSCNLELDINTIPDPETRFDANQVQNVFDELVDLGIEISKEGDIE